MRATTRKHLVTPLAAAAVLAVASVPPARGDDLPVRRAGLWEVKTAVAGHPGGLTVRQCVDAATDRMMLSVTGPLADTACPRLEVARAGSTVTVEAACTLGDRPATARAVITGSFENAYEMKVTAAGAAVPGGTVAMTVTGTWLGPCTADQRPGDVVMPGGVKLNIVEMRRLLPSAGIPLPR